MGLSMLVSKPNMCSDNLNVSHKKQTQYSQTANSREQNYRQKISKAMILNGDRQLTSNIYKLHIYIHQPLLRPSF